MPAVSRWVRSLLPHAGSSTKTENAPVTAEKSPPALPSELHHGKSTVMRPVLVKGVRQVPDPERLEFEDRVRT